MDIVEKLQAFVDAKKWNGAALARAAGFTMTRGSDILARRINVSSSRCLSGLVSAMQMALPDRIVTIDWLLDESQDYPPPLREPETRVIPISEIQMRILTAASLIGEETALRRILNLDPRAKLPKAGTGAFSSIASQGRAVGMLKAHSRRSTAPKPDEGKVRDQADSD